QSTSKPALRPIPLRSIGLSAGLLVLCTFTDTMLHAPEPMEKKLKTPSSMLDALQKQFHDLLFFNKAHVSKIFHA
ncbi:MAG: hypothetical protein ACK5LH_12195, partial [Akkermansiaceae bacterium]